MDTDLETARAELISALSRQQSGQLLENNERRFPRSGLEDLGVRVLAIPSRLFYAFEDAVDGYHVQRSVSDLTAEAKLLQESAFYDRISSDVRQVNLIDIGGGDGIRAKEVAKTLLDRGFSVNYICYDGSDVMIAKNKVTFIDVSTSWQGILGRFEDFTAAHDVLDRASDLNIFLFLGNNYGNYAPSDIHEMFTHTRAKRCRDILVIGTDAPHDASDGSFVLNEFLKYSDDQMRMGVFSEIGFNRRQISDLIQYNPNRHQVEIYVTVTSPLRDGLGGLSFERGDVFLANIARRPPVNVLKNELSDHFHVEVFKGSNNSLALAICRWKND